MQNPMITMLINQAKSKNPQAFRLYEQMRSGNSNPMDILKQITSKFTPEQMNGLMSQAKAVGISDDTLRQVQNGINS
jgi:hypothetical protein